MEQRTDKWSLDRIGKITASRFSDVMAAGKGTKFGKTAYSYAYEILAKEQTGITEGFSNEATEWGIEHESDARTLYQIKTFNYVNQVGFIMFDDMIGCSPDGLIAMDGGIEIKCPYNPINHMRVMINKEIPDEYIPQVQGSLLVTKRKWWDYISYDPRYKVNSLIIIRCKRDEEYIEKLIKRLESFKILLNNLRKNITINY